MKQRSDKNDVMTKGFWREEKDKFRDEMAGLIERSEEKIEKKLKGYIDDKVITKLDWIAGEIQTMRDEQALTNQHLEDLKNDYGKRITKLEKVVKN